MSDDKQKDLKRFEDKMHITVVKKGKPHPKGFPTGKSSGDLRKKPK
jgi:hypothetical protein